MSESNFAQRLRAGERVCGTFAFLDDPASVEIMGLAGMDYALIDMEHTALTMSGVVASVRAADAAGIAAVVRVPRLEEKEILRALESGADAIVVPSLHSADEARRLVAACRYPPHGSRGMCRFSRASGFGTKFDTWPEHVQRANSDIVTVGLVEDAGGAEEIEDIVAELDLVMVGRGDLSTDLGYSGQVDHPEVLAVVDRYERAAKQHDKPMGTLCYSVEDARRWSERGYTFLTYSSDVVILSTAYRGFLDALR